MITPLFFTMPAGTVAVEVLGEAEADGDGDAEGSGLSLDVDGSGSLLVTDTDGDADAEDDAPGTRLNVACAGAAAHDASKHTIIIRIVILAILVIKIPRL
jgi:hypothetical protein